MNIPCFEDPDYPDFEGATWLISGKYYLQQYKGEKGYLLRLFRVPRMLITSDRISDPKALNTHKVALKIALMGQYGIPKSLINKI